MSYALDFVAFFFSFIFSFWWAIVIPILVVVVWDKHLVTKRIAHRVGLKWVFLELQIPAEVPRTPKAMEEVLNSMHGTFRKGNWWRRYILGFIPPYYVFELVLHDGLLKFYIRCEKAFVDLVKSRIYTQYPDSKVVEVENPLKDLPEKAPDPTFDVFGTEFKLAKESSWYPDFTFALTPPSANVTSMECMTIASIPFASTYRCTFSCMDRILPISLHCNGKSRSDAQKEKPAHSTVLYFIPCGISKSTLFSTSPAFTSMKCTSKYFENASML